MIHTKCPQCILYIQDTLLFPLPHGHPLRDQVRIQKLLPLLPDLATNMEIFIKSYVGHKNLAPRLLRDTQELKKQIEPRDYYHIYTGILRWYKDLYRGLDGKGVRKHPFQTDMETLAVLAVELGAIRTGQKESPLDVFIQWFMEQYLFFLNHLEEVHETHRQPKKKSSFVEAKWDRSELDNLYD